LAAQGKSAIDAGGKVLEILARAENTQPATKKDLDAWIEAYDLNVSTMIDAATDPLGSVDALGGRETVVIVELPSMKIVYLVHGTTSASSPTPIAPAIAKMLELLGVSPSSGDAAVDATAP
jgi:hypothetical protein